MICDWIKPNTNIKTKLLYRASEYRNSPDLFHIYRDIQGPKIIFVKINNGNRFGGYTGISWANRIISLRKNGEKDKDAFLFSLNNKLKIMNKSCAYVYLGLNGGLAFGDKIKYELGINYCIETLMGNKNFNFCYDSGSAFNFKNKDLVGVDVKGLYKFDVEDYEVYSIEF